MSEVVALAIVCLTLVALVALGLDKIGVAKHTISEMRALVSSLWRRSSEEDGDEQATQEQ